MHVGGKTCATDFVHLLVHRQAIVEYDAEWSDMMHYWNNRARNVDRGDVRERMSVLPGSEENRFIRIEGKGVMTALGVQGSETICKTMDLTE